MSTTPLAPELVTRVATILSQLTASPYPILPSQDPALPVDTTISPPPAPVKRRASVAFVIRIKPSYAHWPPSNSNKIGDLDTFFAQEWVQYGEPEVLFIKLSLIHI